MYARCGCCETYNLVYEKVGQIINCKSCGTLVDTGIKNLTTYKAGNTPEQQTPSPLKKMVDSSMQVYSTDFQENK